MGLHSNFTMSRSSVLVHLCLSQQRLALLWFQTNLKSASIIIIYQMIQLKVFNYLFKIFLQDYYLLIVSTIHLSICFNLCQEVKSLQVIVIPLLNYSTTHWWQLASISNTTQLTSSKLVWNSNCLSLESRVQVPSLFLKIISSVLKNWILWPEPFSSDSHKSPVQFIPLNLLNTNQYFHSVHRYCSVHEMHTIRFHLVLSIPNSSIVNNQFQL